MSTFHQVAVDALALDAGDRLRLAAELIGSVEGVPDAEWDEAWLAAVRARRTQADGAVSWADARDRILQRLARR